MITDQAFILHKRAFKDSSQLIKLITKNHGILDVIAKGSLRPKSKLNGQLQPFTITQVNWLGKSALKTLTDAEQNTVLVRCAYKNHVSLLYCNELLNLLRLDEQATSMMFLTYQKTVHELQRSTAVRSILRSFEWFLCCELGYELQLPDQANGLDHIEFDPINGLIINHKRQQRKSKGYPCTAQTFQLFVESATLNVQQLNEISQLMRVVINHLVQGKPIQSRELLKVAIHSQTNSEPSLNSKPN